MSANYYEEHGEAFFRDTVNVDIQDIRIRFQSYLNPRASVLDAGCGSGRDTAAFVKEGFRVTAFDSSPKMVALASAYTGVSVLLQDFEEVDWRNEFDGVWAMASLLHVSRERLPMIVLRLTAALRPGGVLFASFKHGIVERRQKSRTFTDMTERTLAELFVGAGLNILDVWTTYDVRPAHADELWVNGIAKRLD
jgi:2-polyprenyl-3-methyl-5-hydroxy-6-metoxy-1,4-benzoquinol methylase